MRRAAVLLFTMFAVPSLFASGFGVTAQGARSMGMGLAYTAVADDASAIYYNPAGLAWQKSGPLIVGGMYVRNIEADFDGTATSPGVGVHEEQATSNNVLPQIYYAKQAGPVFLGIGVFTPFGLPMKWENPSTYSGRFINQKALVRTIDFNPTIAWASGGNFAVGFGVDYLVSKIVFERNAPATGTAIDVLHSKLTSQQFDNHGIGWNAGLLWKSNRFRIGVAYRSGIEVEHEGEVAFTQINTGIPAIDTPVRGAINLRNPAPFEATIDFPDSLDFGFAWYLANDRILAFDADRTGWSSFDELKITVQSPLSPPVRHTDWHDSWAYRAGFETPCFGGSTRCRAGYYRDRTPQPGKDVGPVLPDANRDGFTVGIGFDVSTHWRVDLGEAYVKFKDRTPSTSSDNYFGTWRTTGNEFTVNFGWH